METEAALQDPIVVFDWTKAESVASAVIRAVATASDMDPTEMETLHSAIDCDSLNALFEPDRNHSAGGELVVEFPYNGTLVEVSATGEGRVFTQS